jgi:transcriptional regulator with XRE-family HTH domain
MNPASLLREARLRAGMSQAELAASAGIHQSSVARYESGAITPDLDLLIRLCEHAGYTLRVELQPRDHAQETLIADFADLTPAARLRSAERFARLAAKAARAR